MTGVAGTDPEERPPGDGAPASRPDPAYLIEGMAEALAAFDGDGVFTYVSPAAQSILGRPPEELVGTSAFDVIERADRPEARRRLSALAEGGPGTTDRITLRITRPDGRRTWVEAASRAALDPDGDSVIVAVVREASDQVETQAALDRLSGRFQEMIELLPVVVYECDPGPGGRFHYVSPQIEDMLGYPPEEWLADPELWDRRLHPNDRERTLAREVEHPQIAARTERRVADQYRVLHRDGHAVTIRDVARLCDAEGESPFWRGVLIDVGAEEAAQRALAEANARFREMVDGLPVCVYRAEAGLGGRWEFVSSQIERLIGYRAEELVADPTLWRALIDVKDRDWVLAEEARIATLGPGAEFVIEYRLRARDGHTVWVRDRAVLSEDADGRQMLDGVLTDISAERASAASPDAPPDVFRLVCADCGASWAAVRVERCRECSGVNVEATSLNATLGELATARRQIEGLLDGIHRHLEALGENLRSRSSAARAMVAEEDVPWV